MFLKALTLKGFKSFADTTTLELEPGVTVVVGPNGSGKSNVVDAIGWVLGAQAPSAVRSQRMEDVIFAGTATRAALGRAEVSLTIDNSAGLLPIEFSEVTVSRTLWRSGESEYAINGVNCRLLDVQELFSDTGVGRQQHVIVGQGQIDAVLNARPEERRLIIEEAAGVLKHRKRKERSERRLAATEGNLTRLQDLLREVRRQLRPLERQAEAARRHGDLVAELRALQIFTAGRELATLRRRLADTGAARAELRSEEEMCKRRLGDLDASVITAESELGVFGGDDMGGVLGQVERLAEKGRGLLAVIAERSRGLERERSAFVDQAVVASLEADAAGLRQDLAQVEAESQRLLPDRDALAESESALTASRVAFESRRVDGFEVPTGRAAEARGELTALRTGLERGEVDLRRTHALTTTVLEKLARLNAEAARLAEAVESVEAAASTLDAEAAAADEQAAVAAVTFGEAERRRDDTRAERQAWQARADALGLALDEAGARPAAERVAHLDGVVGTLLDLVEVDRGWESAFEAACGEALVAVVVDSVGAGRRALEVLAEGDVHGAVLALGLASARTPPPVGEPLLAHVRTQRPAVAESLAGLIGHAVVVDGPWQEALDAALAHRGALIVTRDGGRFGSSGWRVSTTTAGATGAALDEARQHAGTAANLAEAAQAAFVAAQDAHDGAQTASRAVRGRRGEQRQVLAELAAARDRTDRDRTEVTAELAALEEQIRDLDERLEQERARATELAGALPPLEAAEADLHDRTQAMTDERGRLEEDTAAVAARRAEIEVRAAAIDERRTVLTRQLGAIEQRLAGSLEARRQAEARRVELDRRELALGRLGTFVGERTTVVQTELAALTERRRRQTEAQRELSMRLEGLRRDRSDAERRLESLRERAGRSEVEEAEVRLRLEQATEVCRTQLDVEPHTAMAAAVPELPEAVTPAARVRDLERELRLMGPINPLALEEFDALSERHAFLHEQLDDVKSTRRDLFKVIRAIDDEIVRVFAAAFADVSSNFEQLFATLFPGGLGRLRLTDPDDLLNCGIEVEAKPSGKNVRKLSLLSGGERSLTALALLFAVFRSRPSPFYVMDEVEAALDDVNLHRFLDLVAEFRREAQLIVVSHQKRTMEAADSLFGVTMQSGGSSKVVSERVAVGA